MASARPASVSLPAPSASGIGHVVVLMMENWTAPAPVPTEHELTWAQVASLARASGFTLP